MEHQRVIVITGPTASGKSALALALAERRQGDQRYDRRFAAPRQAPPGKRRRRKEGQRA